jgi:hypothetical protein
MEPKPQVEDQQGPSDSVERIPIEVTTRTKELNLHVKVIYQLIVTKYAADGTTQQSRHRQSDSRVTIDREDVTDTYPNEV